MQRSIPFLCMLVLLLLSCDKENPVIEDDTPVEAPPVSTYDPGVEGVDYFLPHIDLRNWKVTLPIGNPSEVEPPAILNYADNELLSEFMYNDSTDGSLVFYTYPGASTANSSYSRTELREQMEPGSNKTNWTFAQGGTLRARLAMDEISKEADGDYHRAIVLQIHGRLTDEQRDLIGEDDNNAPPVLKVYWNKGRVRVHTKMLKDTTDTYEEILHTDAWTDRAESFDEPVGFEPFEVVVVAEDGRLSVTLNDTETFVYDDVHLERWGVFDNYFKAGNYLATTDGGAFSRVKFYELEVMH